MYKNYNDLKSDDVVQLHINNLIHHECFTIDFFEKI